MNIELYLKEYIDLWKSSAEIYIAVNEEISIDDKQQRELGLANFSKSLKTEIDFKKLRGEQREQFIRQFQENLALFFKNSLNFSMNETAIVAKSGLLDITREFMQMARGFDPDVALEDIFQASRNLWIINSLQIMMNEPVKLSGSIFAYSMLYPYTDNYLDNPSISSDEKMEFSMRFRQRLQGQKVIPANNMEKLIFDLVSMIENDWDRDNFPGVYESLLGIHDAQTKSIRLMTSKSAIPEDLLCSICIEKGGTSVLADGYMINGKLSEDQERFCFGFGAFLQFVDDIQDVDEDTKGELCTLFTHAAKSNLLEVYTNKTIDFGKNVMGNLKCFSSSVLDDMSKLMIKSNAFLLNEAVALNSQYFSSDYAAQFEKSSPFRFEFIRKRRSNLEANRISLMKKIGSFAFADSELAMQA